MRALLPSLLLVSIAAIGCSPADEAGDEPDSKLNCGTDCSLTLTELTTFGQLNDEQLIPDGPTFLLLADGRLVVGDQSGGQMMVFAPDGSYLQKLGREGDGPGEYRAVKALAAGPGDSVTILGFNTVSIISSQSGLGRSHPVRGGMPTAILWEGSGKMVFNTHYSSLPAFNILSAAADSIGGFGPNMLRGSDGDIDEPIYAITPSRHGGFWTAKNEYVHRIERWTTDGELLQSLDSVPDWFPPYTQADKRSARESGDSPGFGSVFLVKPWPRIMDIQEDSDGLLWIAGIAPDPDWEPDTGVDPMMSREEYLDYQPANPKTHRDGIIEAYEIDSGKLVGRWRFHRSYPRLIGDRVAYLIEQNEAGVWQLTTYSMNLDSTE